MPGYRHALVLEAGAAEAFKALDFDTADGMTVTGDPKATGEGC